MVDFSLPLGLGQSTCIWCHQGQVDHGRCCPTPRPIRWDGLWYMDQKVFSHLTTLIHNNQMACLRTFIRKRVNFKVAKIQHSFKETFQSVVADFDRERTFANMSDPHILQSRDKHRLMDIMLRVVRLLPSVNIWDIQQFKHFQHLRFLVSKISGRPPSACQVWACWQSQWRHRRRVFHKPGPVSLSCLHLFHLYLSQGQIELTFCDIQARLLFSRETFMRREMNQPFSAFLLLASILFSCLCSGTVLS